jgi:hypothetical protein
LPNNVEKQISDRRAIINNDCQYYKEYTQEEYTRLKPSYQFNIPEDFEYLDEVDNIYLNEQEDTLVSYKYRGDRYVYSQEIKYFSVLDKYLEAYTHQDGEECYGYTETTYIAPNLITNLIDNTDFFI